MFVKLGSVRLCTRQLVCILDTREFAKDSYQYATDQNARFLQSLHLALKLLPKVNSLVLDRHTEIDPNSLVSLTKTHTSPLLLSISDCSTQLPSTFFSSPSLQKLVYLDISGLPGSISSLKQPSLLPDLRILKLRAREIDDATLHDFAALYRLRLWSLDLTENRITDSGLLGLLQTCFPSTSLRSNSHFQVEGRLLPATCGTDSYGPFVFIDESESSASFTSPERYFMDAPTYDAQPYFLHQQRQIFRADGRATTRLDSVDGATRILSHQSTTYDAEDSYRTSRGLTHLALSYNRTSIDGISRLLRTSNGQLENFACDSLHLLPPGSPGMNRWPKSAQLFGAIGAAHVFRPVFSSNLRSLRIHHSFVTHIPKLEVDGFSSLAKLYLAETAIRFRADQAFPQAFVPDMNPRLSSLTLTCIPRRSSGPVIDRLINFLKLLSIQERSIADVSTAASSSWRWPGMLKGLRHLRLEFEPDVMDEGFSTSDDLDAEELMNSGETGFSFFEEEKRNRPTAEAKPRFAEHRQEHYSSSTYNSSSSDTTTTQIGRDQEEFVTYRGEWNGDSFEIPVWVGTAHPHRNPIVDEYRQLVMQHGLKDGVGPATPGQVLAGAPDRSYIFHTAWCVAIMPQELRSPALPDLTGMKDVLGALKSYRAAGRVKYNSTMKKNATLRVPLGDPHFFWTGRLEASTEQPLAQSRPAQYWR